VSPLPHTGQGPGYDSVAGSAGKAAAQGKGGAGGGEGISQLCDLCYLVYVTSNGVGGMGHSCLQLCLDGLPHAVKRAFHCPPSAASACPSATVISNLPVLLQHLRLPTEPRSSNSAWSHHMASPSAHDPMFLSPLYVPTPGTTQISPCRQLLAQEKGGQV
jgi:hypothetical protein